MNSDTRFIVFSGYNDFEYVKEGIKLGIENYLLKPLNVNELAATLQNTATKIKKSAVTEAYIKKDKEILKDNILYRWVTNSIDPSELSERAEILDINLGYSYYVVSIIKMLYDVDEDGDMKPNTILCHHAIYEAFRRCSSLVEESSSVLCFCDLDGDIVIIFGTDSGIKSECGIRALLDSLCSKLYGITNTSYVITCGSLESSCLNVHASYDSAKKLQEYRLVNNNKILDHDELQKLSSNRNAVLSIDYSALSILLLNGRRKNTSSFVNEAVEQLVHIDNIAPDVIINYSMELLFHINETLNEFGGNNETEDWNYRELLSGLSSLGTNKASQKVSGKCRIQSN